MAKTSTPAQKIQNKQSSKENEIINSPSENTISTLLNFSKSLSIPSSKSIGKMFVVTN